MKHKSVWQTVKLPHFASQEENISADILIVGGGLCGLLCAYELIEAGVNGENITIIDSNRVCSGTSAYSTAKLTAQHGLIYNKLITTIGTEKATQYAKSNQNAVIRAFEIADKLNITNAVTKLPSYIYAVNAKQMDAIESEQKAAKALGFDSYITVDTELPIKIDGALRFENQAMISPLKFAKAIIEYITKKGCKIYEHTTALSNEKDAVITDKGKIFAKKVIISSRFPFADKPGLYFIKLYQQRSYLLSLENAQQIRGNYIGADNRSLSFRPHNNSLIVCGTADLNGANYSGFYDLIKRVVDIYPDCEITRRWSAEDCITYDNVPYIGRYKALRGERYIATGFNKWGVSTSFAAAKIISEQIMRGYSEYDSVFDPSRSIVPHGIKQFSIHTAELAAELIVDAFSPRVKSSKEISSGETAQSGMSSTKVCMHKDNNGVHSVCGRCSHMGYPLKWNQGEGCWECSCHGSCFDIDGNVINGPAKRKLKKHKK